MPLEQGTASATAKHPRASLRWDCPNAAPATEGKGVLLQEIKTRIPKLPGTELELVWQCNFLAYPFGVPALFVWQPSF